MKKYSHSRHYGSRINWRSLTIAFTLATCFFIGSYADRDDSYVAEQDVFMKPVVVVPEPTVEDKLKEYFPKNWRVMIAVAHAESGLKMESKGYNCFYYKGVATTTPIKNGSMACKVKDRALAWSYDCGIMQLNQKSPNCPDEDIDTHMSKASELSKVCGLDCWSAYKNKSYLAYYNK